MILPLPSASRAESSSWSAPVSRLVINRAMDPAAAALPTGAAGKLTLKLSGVFVDMAPPPTGNKLEKSFSVPVWLTATPDSLMPIGLGPELVLFWTIGSEPDTQAHAEIFRKTVVGFDDSRLDQHLLHRDIDLTEELSHLFQPD